MARKPKTRCCGEWTEARFFSFIRSNLRLLSRKWKPIHEVKRAARRPYAGPDKRRKWEYQCSRCGNWFPDKEIEINHKIPAGSIKCFDDVGPFLERLLVEAEGLEVMCKEGCHRDETKSQRIRRGS